MLQDCVMKSVHTRAVIAQLAQCRLCGQNYNTTGQRIGLTISNPNSVLHHKSNKVHNNKNQHFKQYLFVNSHASKKYITIIANNDQAFVAAFRSL